MFKRGLLVPLFGAFVGLSGLLCHVSRAEPSQTGPSQAKPSQTKGEAAKSVRPNIVWISTEDMSLHLGAYGDKVARTPTLDRLAEAVRASSLAP